MTNARLSQESIEILLRRFPNLRVSQVSMETLVSLFNYSNLRASQVSIEVLGSSSAPIPTVGRILGPPVQMI